ncbi:MAG: hypothetical protein ACR2PG_05695 [Hyphomicrobiaceae bacterium]
MFRLVRPASTIEPAHIFILFYTVALAADFDDLLRRPIDWMFIALSIWVCLALTRLSFLVFLLITTVYFMGWELPDTENHTNLLVITNISIILCLLNSYSQENRGSTALFYETAQPIARLLIIIALAVAGFHKFNRDFINPAVSCIRQFSGDIIDVALGDFAGWGVPPIFFLGLMLAIIIILLWHQRPNLCWPKVDWIGLATPTAVVLLGMALLWRAAGNGQDYNLTNLGIFFLAVSVLCWQLIEAPLLLVSRFQWVALSFSLIVHAQLAMLRIVDFQAISIALLIAFVPANVWHAWNRQSMASIGPLRLHRAHLYFGLNMLGLVIIFANAHNLIDWPRPHTAWGLLFIAALLVMLWPVISDVCSPARTWQWNGTPVFQGSAPRWLYVLPICLLLFCLTSHLGLRTAGNLSMYSNLRTEAGRNNHLVLGADQLKWAGYQEDVVHIVEIGEGATIGNYLDRWGKLEGNLLPLVEFRKLLLRWRRRGAKVPMTIAYKGNVTQSANIVEHPGWRVNSWDWEMRLMDFRVIQSDSGPNTCRW